MSDTLLSVDPANRSGFALWSGDMLITCGVLRAVGKAGKWVAEFPDGERITFASELEAWQSVVKRASHCVCEVGRGSFRNADMPLGKRLGYIRTVVEMCCSTYHEIALSEWRRVVKESLGIAWPAGKAVKQKAQDIVRSRYGRDVSEDTADAILIGYAWQRLWRDDDLRRQDGPRGGRGKVLLA